MKLTKGQLIEAPVVIAGSNISSVKYQVKVIDCIESGEHFDIYQGEDIQGTHVCLKTIHYRCEKKEISTAAEYILNRRQNLAMEQRILSLSYPMLPEPLAMLIITNDCPEDQKLFRRLPEWEKLRTSEPIFVQEYFYGASLDKLKDKLRLLSLSRRLEIAKKISNLCQFLNHQGCMLNNLHPSQLIMDPDNDENIYLVGLHNICSIPPELNPNMIPNCKINWEQIKTGPSLPRQDFFQFGMLLYFLLTLHDPPKEGWWQRMLETGLSEEFLNRLNKAMRAFSFPARWLVSLVSELLHPEPLFRPPDWESIIRYFDKPPQHKISYLITDYNIEKIRLQFEQNIADQEFTALYIQTSISKTKTILHELSYRPEITLPGIGMGEVVISVAARTQEERLTWWNHQKIQIFPDIDLQLKPNVSLDKLGFQWRSLPNLTGVMFLAIDRQENCIVLGRYSGNEVVLPPPNVVLPFYQKLRIEAKPIFLDKDKNEIIGPKHVFEAELLPAIPEPSYRKVDNEWQFSLALPKRQAKFYEDFELLKNGWPQNAKMNITSESNEDLVVFHWQEELDLFESHQFAFRVLVSNVGWRTGPTINVVLDANPITELSGYEEEWGSLNIQWKPVQHSQILCYQISCEGKVLKRIKDSFFAFEPDIQTTLTKEFVEVSVAAVYSNGHTEKISPTVSTKIKISHSKQIVGQNVRSQITPFSVTFSVAVSNPKSLQDLGKEILLQRRAGLEESPNTIARLGVGPSMILTDTNVTMGKTYQYCLNIGDTGGCLLEKTVTIPEINIVCTLQNVGFEDLFWDIRIPPETALYIEGQLEIRRTGEGTQQSHLFSWSNDEGVYTYEDNDLAPGGEYHYTLIVHWQGRVEPYYRDMGVVKTKEFQIQESIKTFYNRAIIHWAPTPQGQIESIEIYDSTGRFIASTKSDSITLENLEPFREYRFPLKYRYFSKKSRDGKIIAFKTLPFSISSQITDVGVDSFRMRWEISDIQIAKRIKEFVLQVSNIDGKYMLSSGTRTVYLKQLFPGTEYNCQLSATLKSGHSITLTSNNIVTQIPNLEILGESDLIHHLQWKFPNFPSIDKIEISRNESILTQKSSQEPQEVYDSEFKHGEEACYKFYYILKNEKKIFVTEKKIKALTLQELSQLLQVEASQGRVHWDYNNFKKFKYLKYIELFRDNISIDKKGNSTTSMFFDDLGQTVNGEPLGLPGSVELNYHLDIVGVAPTGPKCKRKWSLNIRKLRCEYNDLPENFSYAFENSCIYFDWNKMDTAFLQQIILRRSDTGIVLYQGINQENSVYDDNQEHGLIIDQTYSYTVELIYKNHRTIREFEIVFAGMIDTSRLNLDKKIIGSVLQIVWNGDIKTSFEQVGCRQIFSPTKRTWTNIFQQKTISPKDVWIPFAAGMLAIPLPGNKEFQYQILLQDKYGHINEFPVEKFENPDSH